MYRTPRCTICWSTSPPVFSFCVFNRFCCKKPPTFENLSPGKRKHCRSIIGSRDTSQGRWEWPVAVVRLPAFVARLVRQVRLIPLDRGRVPHEICTCVVVQVVPPPPPSPSKCPPGHSALVQDVPRTVCPRAECPQGTLYPRADCPLLVQNSRPPQNSRRQVNSWTWSISFFYHTPSHKV